MITTIAAVPAAQAAPSITRSVVGNGGLGGTTYTPLRVVRSTVGQPVVGRFTTGSRVVNAGFWAGTPTPVVGLAESSPAPIEHYRLYSAVPNPFNPRTSIAFDVPAPGGRVKLAIHDVRGRLVKTLVDGEALPGHRVMAWDGTDDTGRGVSSGIFILSLEGGGKRWTQKLTLLR
jgi:hypothetical protein